MANFPEEHQISSVYDVVIVGAGISGINCAYRLQTELPDLRFTILEGRDDIGGTWDLFKYPGIRADTEMYTYSFGWAPWPHSNPIGTGSQIKQYMKDCVSMYNLDRYIRLQHKVLSADWSREDRQWKLIVSNHDRIINIKADFLVLGTGYFDYDTPLQTETVIPGLEDFKGKLIHPQFWPTDYDYSGRKLAIIGSGASSISMFPELCKEASQVTMVQRSPTYIVSTDDYAPSLSSLLRFAPLRFSFLKALDRVWFALVSYLNATLCYYFPSQMRTRLRQMTLPQLPARLEHDIHFQPKYNPWEQRMCLAPDGDFFKALHSPVANIATGAIDRVTDNSVQMKDGTKIDVNDIIIATGLRLQIGGSISLSVDEGEIKLGGRFLWNGSMVEGVPNMVVLTGYTNASWTLGADSATYIFIRVIKDMKSRRLKCVVPRIPENGFSTINRMWELSSTYIVKAESFGRLPVYGDRGPWRPRRNHLIDYAHAHWGDVTTGLVFST
ncbi:FAD/NAD(P)-binding domain-containing protein [Camillea tinctor]|nr:FAD/NAD(P)-binding domain-containing protein [Camillea tinctor]